jgi:hypothetical protein
MSIEIILLVMTTKLSVSWFHDKLITGKFLEFWFQVQKHKDNEVHKNIKLPANHLTSPSHYL